MKYAFFVFLLFPGAVLAADSSTTKKADSTQPVLTLNIDKTSEVVSAETYSAWTKQKTALVIDNSYESQAENSLLCPLADKLLCDILISQRDRQHFRVRSQAVFDTDTLKSYLEDLARRTDSDPQDARFVVEEGQVSTFAPESDGIELDVEKSLPLVADLFKNSAGLSQDQKIELAYNRTKPAVTAGSLNGLGISSLIGEGVSNFKGSPKNRIFNINVAAKRFNGVLIKPGEEFSFVSHLGEVDGDHGYLPELVIKNNATEPEFGGGICQVSTTAFRAAIYSGLKITARKNHAYPVSYYSPQGMDSTVYIPKPDLRFKNNTPGHILIQTKIVGTQLTFDFYGTDDGRKTTVDGPTITERQPDGALKATFTQHVVDKDGNEFIKDIFNSAYKSPYLFPHPGGPTLSVKPANWSNDQWKNYQQMLKDMAKTAAEAAKKKT